jgi:hypothetical protein
MSKDLLTMVEFNEQYIDECLVDIADLVMQGKVFLFYDGVFSGWSLKKQKKNDKHITWQNAIDFCVMLEDGDF